MFAVRAAACCTGLGLLRSSALVHSLNGSVAMQTARMCAPRGPRFTRATNPLHSLRSGRSNLRRLAHCTHMYMWPAVRTLTVPVPPGVSGC